MKYNASQLQTKYGLNRATITKWVKAGKIVRDADGYIEEDLFLMVFQKSPSWKFWKEKNETEAARITSQLPLSTPNQLTGSDSSPSLPGLPAGQGSAGEKHMNKVDLQNLKLHEDLVEKRRKNAEASGRLIDRQLLRVYVGRVGEIDSTEWRSYSSRVIDDVMAICGVSGPEILAKLTHRMDDEVFSILASSQRAQDEFLDSLPIETIL